MRPRSTWSPCSRASRSRLCRGLLALTLLGLLVARPGCSSEQDPVAADCPSRCQSKAESCGAPADIATLACSEVCDKAPRESQLGCVEDMPCETFMSTFNAGGSVCGIDLGFGFGTR